MDLMVEKQKDTKLGEYGRVCVVSGGIEEGSKYDQNALYDILKELTKLEKMNQRFKCEIRNYEIARRQHGGNLVK